MQLRRMKAVIVALGFLVAACGSPAADLSGDSIDAAADPAIEQGATSTGMVEIDGRAIDYVTSVPIGFALGDEAPLLLVFPPGGQTLGDARSLVARTFASEANRLGWVVVSPAAPDGELFFQGSEELVPAFLDWVETWVVPEGGAPHVSGVSNGGISVFRYAAQNSDRVLSMTTLPGFPTSSEDRAALEQLTDLPIRMFVGSIDADWRARAEETVESVDALSGDIELTIFDREGHVMRSMSDGVLLFEQLETFR